MKNVPDARGRILKASVQCFAEKSFAGARIDDIARTANVPKSLIYYHFKSKETILEVLLQEFIDGFKELMIPSGKENHADKSKTTKYKLQEHYAKFASENVDLIRVVMIESLRKDRAVPLLFKTVEELVNGEGDKIKESPSYDRDERLVAEFFTSLMPLYSFLCFQEKWCEYFKMDTENFRQIFIHIYDLTHGAYHRNHE